MATVKIREENKGEPQWIGLYTKELRNRTRKDKNLADLPDKSIARENLELKGEVIDHWHDKRYLPKIQEAFGKSQDGINQLTKEFESLRKQHKLDIDELKEHIENNTRRIAKLEEKATNIENTLINIEGDIQIINNKLKALFDEDGFFVFPNGNKMRVNQKK